MKESSQCVWKCDVIIKLSSYVAMRFYNDTILATSNNTILVV